MLVKELIEILSKRDPEDTVYVSTEGVVLPVSDIVTDDENKYGWVNSVIISNG